jgi:colanic acid/amylovoran biosynthesis protein
MSVGFETRIDSSTCPLPRLTHVTTPSKWTPRWWIRKGYQALSGMRGARPYPFEGVNYDAAILLGGDNWSFDYGIPYPQLEFADWALSAKLPLVLWGASIGPFEGNDAVRQRIITLLRNMHLVCVRETATMEYLASLGVTANVLRVADPAFLLPAVRPDDLPAELDRVLQTGCIGINVPVSVHSFPPNEKDWQAHVVDAIDYCAEQLALPIVLVPHVYLHHGCDDQSFLVRVSQELRLRKREVYSLPRFYSARELKWIIGKTRVFAGGRTHTTIASLSQCVPTLFLSYSIKAQGLCQDMCGNKESLLSLREFTGQTLSQKLRDLLNNEHRMRQQLSNTLPGVQDLARAGAAAMRHRVLHASNRTQATVRI